MRRMCALVLIGGALILGACGGGGSSAPAASANDIPVTLSAGGDPAKGEQVYLNSGCPACHNPTTQKLVGPGLAGVLQQGGVVHDDGVDYGGKLPNGQERTEDNVAAWIKSGGQGQVGAMPAQNISDQDLKDLLAYLRTLKK